MDNYNINEIRKLISEIAESKMREIASNMEYVYDGRIVDKSGVLYLEIMDSLLELSTIPNYTGVELKAGNAVRVYARGGRMNDLYIGVCFKKESWGEST